MVTKVLLTIVLLILGVLANGAFYGLVFGHRGEKAVYPSTLITSAVIIYFLWFR